MKKLTIIVFALFLSTATYAQLDEKGKQFLDSLGIKYDPNDPDAEQKAGKAFIDMFMAQYDSAMKIAENIVIDPENTEGLLAEILGEFNEMELCPYKGEITFSSITTYKDSEERTGLPDPDCEFKATKKEENKTEQTWTFQKLKRYEGTANVNYTIDNRKKVTEYNSCRRCCKMDNGVKIDIFEPGYVNSNSSTVKTETYSATKTASLKGLRLDGTNALTKITFDTLANNYTITVKAATEPAKWTTKSVTTNSGCPYDENFENELGAIFARKCDRSFGPFPGSPYQKSLKQTVTQTIISEDGKGQTIEKISFNLTR